MGFTGTYTRSEGESDTQARARAVASRAQRLRRERRGAPSLRTQALAPPRLARDLKHGAAAARRRSPPWRRNALDLALLSWRTRRGRRRDSPSSPAPFHGAHARSAWPVRVRCLARVAGFVSFGVAWRADTPPRASQLAARRWLPLARALRLAPWRAPLLRRRCRAAPLRLRPVALRWLAAASSASLAPALLLRRRCAPAPPTRAAPHGRTYICAPAPPGTPPACPALRFSPAAPTDTWTDKSAAPLSTPARRPHQRA
jgi:hypothetical protein